MSTRYNRPNPSKSLLVNITKLYGNMNLAADQLQFFLVALVREALAMGKKELMSGEGDVAKSLDYLFRNTPRGIDRGTLSAWFVEFTPIRPVFDAGNGHYKKMSFARKGAWDLEGAMSTPWHAVSPEATRKVQLPDLEKQIARLMVQAAKLAAASELSVDDVTKVLQDGVASAKTKIADNMGSESVVKFVDDYAAHGATVH